MIFKFKRKPKPEPTVAEIESCTRPHYHKDENGILVQCYHVCKRQLLGAKQVLCSPAFWIGMTIGYPFEHFLYEKVWPFYHVAEWLKMH